MLAPLAAAVGEFARRQATDEALEIVAVSAIWALVAVLAWGLRVAALGTSGRWGTRTRDRARRRTGGMTMGASRTVSYPRRQRNRRLAHAIRMAALAIGALSLAVAAALARIDAVAIPLAAVGVGSGLRARGGASSPAAARSEPSQRTACGVS